MSISNTRVRSWPCCRAENEKVDVTRDISREIKLIQYIKFLHEIIYCICFNSATIFIEISKYPYYYKKNMHISSLTWIMFISNHYVHNRVQFESFTLINIFIISIFFNLKRQK